MARMVTALAEQIAPASLERADRKAWTALRREGLGGSDLPPVLGADDFGRTRWQVWLDKTGQLPGGDDPDPRAAERMWFGHAMEDVAARRFRDLHPGTRLSRVGMLARRDQPWMRVNLDRRVHGCPDGPCAWECKNRGAYASKEWDRAGNPDGIPDGPVIQVMWQMLVTGYRHTHLACVIGGNELRTYRVDWDPEFGKTLETEAGWFWHDCVLAGKAPPVDAAERTGQLLARLWDADPDKIVTAPPEIVALHAALHDAAASATAAKAEADRIKHELQAWLGDGEVCLDPGSGRPLFTWKQNGTFRETDFRDEHPDLWLEHSRLVRVTDTAALEAAAPAVYAAYRARAFNLKKLVRPEGGR
jgi:putative phage-type endonuclease